MGLMENLGAVASTYMDEKEKLQTAEERGRELGQVTDFGLMKFFVIP